MKRWVTVVALLTLVACGSTVPGAQRRTVQRGMASNALDATGDTVAGDDGGLTVDAGGSSTGRSARAGTSSGRTSTGALTANVAPAAFGPGVTADKIYVGLSYAVNSGAANTAIGATGITAGDPKRTSEIIIEDINAHGGVGGRKLEPVWHQVDGTTTAPNAVIFQQMCDDWTQDHKVFVGFGGGDETLLQCMHNRGALLLQDDLTSADAAKFKRYPYYVELSSLNLDRTALAEVAALDKQGYFSGWNAATGAASSANAKVGIVTFDSPSFAHATDQVMVPALKKIGIDVSADDIRRVEPNQRVSDTGPQAAASASAVLRLRASGVTHIILFDERGLLTLLFMQSADSQGYRPRYGLNTQNGPQALKDGASLPGRQLIGMRGIGWLPSLDLQPAINTRNGPYSNPSRRKCYDLLTSKGQTFSDANAESIAMGLCSAFWFLRDAVRASGNVLNRTGFMQGVAAIGASFEVPGTFGSSFSATKHDGVTNVRYYSYDEGCSCMRYTSGNVAVP